MPAVQLQMGRSYARGELAEGEDVQSIVECAIGVRDAILAGQLTPLVHGDVTGRARDEEVAQQISRLRGNRLKRYVVPVDTHAGRRILKLTEPGHTWKRAVFTGSRARKEHHWHARAQSLRIAATETRGFLVLRRGPFTVRGVQVQTVMAPGLVSLEEHLIAEIQRHGGPAVEPFAEHLANSHALKFFHADLKGFHAFVTDIRPQAHGPAQYRMLWSDFGRVSFRISPRRRIINLYQAFRFLLPEDKAIQRRFVTAYCNASGWRRNDSEAVLRSVERFLRRKLRSHPTAYANPWPHSYNA